MPTQTATTAETPTRHVNRVVSLPTRFRQAPGDVIPMALFIMLIPGSLVSVLVMLIGTYLAGHSPSVFAFLITWAIMQAFLVVPALWMSNEMVNQTVTEREKKAERETEAHQKAFDAKLAADAELAAHEARKYAALRDALRLPLLEWAVTNDLVGQIDGLSETLATAVVSHTDFIKRTANASDPAPAAVAAPVAPSSGLPG